jgi:hypothetical protein
MLTFDLGFFVYINPNELLIDNPDIFYHISATSKKHQKSFWYFFIKFNPFIDNIFSKLDLRKHDKLRAIISLAINL